MSVKGAESLTSLRTRLWRAFRQFGQRHSGKREDQVPLAERGRLVDSAKGTERGKAGTHWLSVDASWSVTRGHVIARRLGPLG